MPVSDDQKLAMWREVLALCRVKPGENIAVPRDRGGSTV